MNCGETVAVKVTLWPGMTGLLLAISVVVVAALLTTTAGAEVLALVRKLVSPEYWQA